MQTLFERHSRHLLETEPPTPLPTGEPNLGDAAEPAAGPSTEDPKAYLNAVWPEIRRSVFGRLSNKLGTRTL